jgi:hypothetical protein
MHGMHKGR